MCFATDFIIPCFTQAYSMVQNVEFNLSLDSFAVEMRKLSLVHYISSFQNCGSDDAITLLNLITTAPH